MFISWMAVDLSLLCADNVQVGRAQGKSDAFLVRWQPTLEELRNAGRQGVEFGALLDTVSVFDTEGGAVSSRKLDLPAGVGSLTGWDVVV